MPRCDGNSGAVTDRESRRLPGAGTDSGALCPPCPGSAESIEQYSHMRCPRTMAQRGLCVTGPAARGRGQTERSVPAGGGSGICQGCSRGSQGSARRRRALEFQQKLSRAARGWISPCPAPLRMGLGWWCQVGMDVPHSRPAEMGDLSFSRSCRPACPREDRQATFPGCPQALEAGGGWKKRDKDSAELLGNQEALPCSQIPPSRATTSIPAPGKATSGHELCPEERVRGLEAAGTATAAQAGHTRAHPNPRGVTSGENPLAQADRKTFPTRRWRYRIRRSHKREETGLSGGKKSSLKTFWHRTAPSLSQLKGPEVRILIKPSQVPADNFSNRTKNSSKPQQKEPEVLSRQLRGWLSLLGSAAPAAGNICRAWHRPPRWQRPAPLPDGSCQAVPGGAERILAPAGPLQPPTAPLASQAVPAAAPAPSG